MLTSKQRSNLRGLAQKIEPVTQVGKSGVTESLIESLDKTIEKRRAMWYDNNIRYDGEVGPSNEKSF